MLAAIQGSDYPAHPGSLAAEPLLFTYTKYGCRWRIRQNWRYLASQDTSAWMFKWGFYTKILHGGPYPKYTVWDVVGAK